MTVSWKSLTQQDKFFILTTAIVPLLLWWVFIGRARYTPKGPLA